MGETAARLTKAREQHETLGDLAQLFLADGARLFCAVAWRAVVQLRLQAGKHRLSRRHRFGNIGLGMRRAHKACFVQSRCKVHPPI